MAPTPVRFVPESPGIAPQTVTQESQRRPISRYAGRGRSSRSLRGLETRGTASCCIRSKSSRFYLHPFREGNGRTQRIMLTRIAAGAGWQLDWGAVTGAENDHACRSAAEAGDFTALHDVVGRITTAMPPAADRDRQAWRAAQAARLSFAGPPRPGTPKSGDTGAQRPRNPGRGRGPQVER